jgi:hypothetical protein
MSTAFAASLPVWQAVDGDPLSRGGPQGFGAEATRSPRQ